MTKINLAAALLALGSLAALPACSSPAYYQGSAAPMPAAAANPAISPDMVRQVQTALQQQNLYNGAIDGIWGPQTQSAVQSFQQSHQLNATGQLDTATVDALNLPTNAAPSQQSSVTPAPNTMNSPTSNGSTMPPNSTMSNSTNTPDTSNPPATTSGSNGTAPPP